MSLKASKIQLLTLITLAFLMLHLNVLNIEKIAILQEEENTSWIAQMLDWQPNIR